ncbi:MAG: radical SAM family heme chaperone HemW [Pseudomonadota bacterium]
MSGFGVYVHWPFCARICPYCDFNVYRDRDVDAERWSAALVRDLEYWAERTGDRRLTSLYFGGGTPSLAPPLVIDSVINACDRLWGFEADPEITLEANPTDAELGRFEMFRSVGVNRLSLGVQSLDDADLKFLGRNHDAAGAMAAIERALALFPRVSADFIYALPRMSADRWANELQRAIATGVRHLSLYQLTVEPGTAFGRQVAKGRWAAADEDISADLFDLTQDLTSAAGLPAYEISNHAAPSEESRHNFLYWRQGDYAGAGPGAHGRVIVAGKRRATETEPNPARYLSLVEAQGAGIIVDDPLTEEEFLTERLAMGLRTIEGTPLSAAEWAQLSPRIAALSAEGCLERRGEALIATAKGRRLLNATLARLLT